MTPQEGAGITLAELSDDPYPVFARLRETEPLQIHLHHNIGSTFFQTLPSRRWKLPPRIRRIFSRE